MLRAPLVGLAALGLLAATAGPALAVSQKLRWKFDSVSAVVTTVADDSGKGHTGTAVSANGGQITAVSPGRDGIGKAVQFPAVCAGTCPRAQITSPDAADLNPGTALFSYGAWLNVTLAELTSDHGSNVFQKGSSETSQWKLQVDDAVAGRPSCITREAGGLNSKKALSSVGVADGSWHKVTCQRTATDLQILVDNVVRGSVTVPAAYVINPTGMPVTLGARSTGTNGDQYHGRLDDIYYNLD
ncbi:LamG-like jellyroll fold domain-containing protein [Kribbella sp. NPDC056861]|uniref:LamG-like jellyroll fold domain-containing protein n=1 Tax=Kribbella sp. NPDC056861 TaxID=3154857 RepID=UPI00342207AB